MHAPLREPIDYEEDVADQPGEVLVIDACDPSFSRMERGKGPLRSIGATEMLLSLLIRSQESLTLLAENPRNLLRRLLRF